MAEPMHVDNATLLQDTALKLDRQQFSDFEKLRSHIHESYPRFKDKFQSEYGIYVPRNNNTWPFVVDGDDLIIKLGKMDPLSEIDKAKYPDANFWGARLLHHLHNTSHPHKDSSTTEPFGNKDGFVWPLSVDILTWVDFCRRWAAQQWIFDPLPRAWQFIGSYSWQTRQILATV
jgi:hypothetical protein